MSKKLIISISIIFIVFVAGISFWYISSNKKTQNTNTNGNILPFGQGGDTNTNIDNNTSNGQEQTNIQGTNQKINLNQISKDPVAGAVVFDRGGKTFVRFVERATGNIIETDMDTLTQTRISNTTIPKVDQAFWKKDGSAVVLRYLKDDSDSIQNLFVDIKFPKQTATTTPDSSFAKLEATILDGNIEELTVNNDKLIYVTKSGSVMLSDMDGKNPKEVFNTPFKEWVVSLLNNDIVSLTTKASSNVPGFLYFVNTKTKTFNKILGNVLGLTTLSSKDGTNTLYSKNSNSGLLLMLKNNKTGSDTESNPKTIPEKCIWSEKESYTLFCATPIDQNFSKTVLDDWYQGKISFVDNFISTNIYTGTVDLLLDPKKASSLDIDAINLSLSPEENYLIFMNKKDLSLWELKLK